MYSSRIFCGIAAAFRASSHFGTAREFDTSSEFCEIKFCLAVEFCDLAASLPLAARFAVELLQASSLAQSFSEAGKIPPPSSASFFAKSPPNLRAFSARAPSTAGFR